MPDIRTQSAEIIQKILEDKVFFAELKKQIPEKDLAFANMLILSSLRYWEPISNIFSTFIKKKIPNKHRLAEYLIKLSITEILFMDTAPYAVIDQTVNNIKRHCDKFLAGMANAVLRKVLSQKEPIKNKIAKMSLIPTGFLPVLTGYSRQEIEKISQIIKVEPPLDITVKNDPLIWQEKLNADLLPNGTLRLYNAGKITDLQDYNLGEWWIQDVAASLPVITAGNIKRKDVIDLCAAPGGKTAQLAVKEANVVALDISENRLTTLKNNMKRLRIDNIKVLNADALEYTEKCQDLYDIILLDAPCSATGTLRRHPEIIHIKTVQDVAEQAELQYKILNNCTNILKIGGILIYSVCSISKIEGELQILRFLNSHPQFKRVAITEQDISIYGVWTDNLINENGEIRTMPYYLKSQRGMDGFFICKLQRII